MKLKWPDAAARLAAVWALYPNDPGLVADKARWQRETGDWIGARRTLADARVAPGSVRYPLPWMKLHLDFARAASNDSQWDLAYRIAADTNAYAPGTVLRDRPLAERDVLTSLEWLAGWTAFRNLGRPASAIAHFDRYSLAAQTPQTQSKGDYWAGRAASAAGQAAVARGYYEKAGTHPDHFYGQLSLEQLGRPITTPSSPQLTIAPFDRSAFERNEVVRAARLLAELGDQQRLTTFVRALADSSWNEQEQLMVADLARSLNRPDLGVRLARNARKSGEVWLWDAGYPRLPLSPLFERQWTMIHAITRQESEFYQSAVSHANARGLMQLMPGTARETAGKVGLPYDYSRLTADTNYNITLGSTYFANLLDRYGGNHVMAVAAYNAGPGNVNKWVSANGDPRMAGADVIEWIEKIPIFETRNYVQRVLENAVIYDVLNPAKARMTGLRRLSAYLGRPTPAVAATPAMTTTAAASTAGTQCAAQEQPMPATPSAQAQC
jgi:soluble lytic murein transglycosylase